MGEKIKEKRTALGMTQEQLADKMNVTQGAVQQWEANKSNPSNGKLLQLADVLQTTVEDLLRRE